MRVAPFVAAGILAGAAAAQACPRPEPPPGGHPLDIDLIVPVTYSDGYQTFGSLIKPQGQAPTCGWPLVVFVHPLGSFRGHNLATQEMIAGQGYAIWNYDVRGQGTAIPVNVSHPQAGSTIWGALERHDLVEQIQFVASNPAWTGIVDTSRLAVMGSSQGGAHAWMAAAYSGQPVAYPGRPTHVFPAIACVAPADLVADPADSWLRGGQLWNSWFVEALSGSYSAMPFDAPFIDACRNAFIAQDPGSLISAWNAEGRLLGPSLAASSVPVLYSHAYLDIVDGPLSAVMRLESMQGPVRALLGPNGHGATLNSGLRDFRFMSTVRWFHRFLWGEQNEVELEAPFVLPELPLRAVERDDPSFAWSSAHVATTLAPPSSTRMWLHDDFVLRDAAPVAPQADAIVQQTIDPQATTFTPQEYLFQPTVRDVQNVLTVCPLSEHVWSTTVVAESQMAASPQLHLRVVPQQPSWMLVAFVTLQTPDPGEAEVVVATAAISSATSVAGIAEDHDVRMTPIAVRIPAGSTLRLRLRSLWLRMAPQQHSLEVAPLFHDFRVDIQQGDPAGSWVDVPLTPTEMRVAVDRTWLELAAPVPLSATVRGGTQRAGAVYFTVVSFGGHLPGVPVLNTTLPIEADWLAYTSAGSSLQPWFSGFYGVLDPSGEAASVFDLSSLVIPQALNGLRITFCAFAFDGAGGAASNPADVMMR
jgi:predicted acyl esterase